MWFEAISGLRINLDKNELIAVGRVENLDDLALEFGCKVGVLPLTWVFLLMPYLNLWRLRKGWKRGFVKGWPSGIDYISLKKENYYIYIYIYIYISLFLVCLLYTLCLCFAFQGP